MTAADVLSGQRRWEVIEADVLVALRGMADNSFHGLLSDPAVFGI